jgi:PIN domain nuclease of toxin-antitoxin system
MSASYLLDTHALFWHLTNSAKLSERAKRVFGDASRGQVTLILSPIVLLELYGVVKKYQAPLDFSAELHLLEKPPFRIAPITVADLHLLDQLETIPELHDRLIAATALRLNVPILTRDPLIMACSTVSCVW